MKGKELFNNSGNSCKTDIIDCILNNFSFVVPFNLHIKL